MQLNPTVDYIEVGSQEKKTANKNDSNENKLAFCLIDDTLKA